MHDARAAQAAPVPVLQPIQKVPLNLDPTTHEGERNLNITRRKAKEAELRLTDLSEEVRACTPCLDPDARPWTCGSEV